jgi:hypothetical protein
MKQFLFLLIAALFVFSCATTQIQPWETGSGYILADNMPEWIMKDFENDNNFGILRYAGLEIGGVQYHVFLIDENLNQPKLDGNCDTGLVVVEVGFNDRYGPNTPTVEPVFTFPCDDFDKVLESGAKTKEALEPKQSV